MSETKAKKLRNLLENSDMLAIPGCYDCASARVIQSLGFNSVYLTGYGTEASILGRPDLGFMGMSEIVNHARNINDCVDLPLISDMDAGFGGMFNFERTIRSFERAGVAGVHFEDQTQPKRCGCLSGKTVIPKEEAIAKVKLAIDTREDPDFVLIARSDAKEQHGFDEVLRRLDAFLEAGADLVMVGERYDLDEMRKLCQEFPRKLMFDGGMADWEETNLSIAEFSDMGMKIVIYPLVGIYAAMRGVKEIYQILKDKGQITTEELFEREVRMDEANKILGIDKYMGMYDIYHLT